MATAKKSNTNKKTNTTTNNKGEQVKAMTYPQTLALVNALYHSKKTKAELCAMIDKLNPDNKGGMKPEAKAKWLEKAGQEHCSYGQCKMYAFTLLSKKAPYETISQIIDKLDKDNGYVRTPKEDKTEEAVTKVNEQAKKVAPKGNKKNKKQEQANA